MKSSLCPASKPHLWFSCLLLLFSTLPAFAQKETVVYSFGAFGSGDGAAPTDGVVTDPQGNIYGTTSQGGSANLGTVFKITPAGVETILHSFLGGTSDGASPFAGVVRDPQGNLYGTTTVGGKRNLGTVFEITSAGTEKILVDFDVDNGDTPYGGLVRDSQGNLYGTTTLGGANFLGAVYKINTSQEETVLYSFKGSPTDGELPQGRLVLDTKGNLYGTTYGGGSGSFGTVFEITSAGTETVLYNFTGGADGGLPTIGSYLILDPKENLYGVTLGGGMITSSCKSGCGVVFEVTPGSGEKVLHAFSGEPDGQYPEAGLVRDPKGNLYGATLMGGKNGDGSLFEVTTAEKEVVIYSFGAYTGDGENPEAGLTSDGKTGAYGTTITGGPNSTGTVYHIVP